MTPDYELLLQRLEALLAGGDRVFNGTVAKLGSTVQVNIGNGRYVTAENLGVRVPGEVGVVCSGGKYYVYPVKGSELVQRKVLQKRKFRQVIPKVETTYPFKILFSVVEDGIQKFYVGGDRKEPQLVFEIDTNIYYKPRDESEYIFGYIANTGKRLNDWVVGIRYCKEDIKYQRPEDFHYLSVISPKKQSSDSPQPNLISLVGISYPSSVDVITYSDHNTPGIGLLRWKGSGLWITEAASTLNLGRFFNWDTDTEILDRVVDYEAHSGLGRPSSVDVVMPLSWANQPNFVLPFPSVASYVFNKNDSNSLRNVPNLCTYDRETFSHDKDGSYIASGGYYSSIYQPGSILDHFMLTANVNPYFFDQYSEGMFTQIGNRSFIASEEYSNSDLVSQTTFGNGNSFTLFIDGIRHYLSINPKEKLFKSSFAYVMTYTATGAFRSSISSSESWNRDSFIYDCKGKTYLIPGKYIDAFSKRSEDTPRADGGNQQFTLGLVTPEEYIQNYSQTITADPDLESCLFFKGDYYFEQVPFQGYVKQGTENSFIYDKKIGAEYLIIETDEVAVTPFNPKTHTFLSKSGYRMVYLDSLPIDIKTKDSKLAPKVQKYVVNGNIAEIEETEGKSTKVFSLKIDTTKEHHIQGISFFED